VSRGPDQKIGMAQKRPYTKKGSPLRLGAGGRKAVGTGENPLPGVGTQKRGRGLPRLGFKDRKGANDMEREGGKVWRRNVYP